MHLHVHTNSEELFTGMCVVSGTIGEIAKEAEEDRRFGTKETLYIDADKCQIIVYMYMFASLTKILFRSNNIFLK